MKEKRIRQLFIAAFILMLVLPLLLTSFKKDVVSEIENRTLANFPKLTMADGEKNPNFIPEFESWFNDHVGFREPLFEANLKLQYDLFDHSANEKVMVGKDGWLFFTGDGNAAIPAGEYPNFGEKELEAICQKQISIRDKLKSQGIEYVIMLPPSKVSIYPEYIKGDFSVRKTPSDILADYLEAHSDLKVVRLKDTLLEEKEKTDELLYFKTDTHWNTYGSSVAYRQLVKKLKEWKLTDTEAAEMTLIKEDKTRDLSKMLVSDQEHYTEESYTRFEIQDPSAVFVESGELYEYVQQYITDNGITRGYNYVNENQDLPSYLVFSDSMFMNWMAGMVAENCSALTAIQKPTISQEMIDVVKPDVVILEMVERYLNTMAQDDYCNAFLHVTIQKQGELVEISYKDDGAYQHMWFPVWSNDNSGDIIWHEAERSDDNTWHVTVNLADYGANGVYNVHFYQSEDSLDHAVSVHTDRFDIGNLF
ncbi:MAG: GBS Bsp-like repeat-containing protein [Lachnospiraceae bacterium]|nr:GBS Bsp-like repeat-containing protein [Lachnospiraceae bacterium]